MVSFKELKSRINADFRFEKKEILTLLAAILITAFIFSFSNWGDDAFNAVIGFKNLILMILATSITFFFWSTFQKVYALAEGYEAKFRVWWPGLGISLLVAFISFGRFAFPLIGGTTNVFNTRYRLGEFRYGYSNQDNAQICFSGIIANLLLAMFFAVGNYFSPQNYFFPKGIILNLSMAFFSLLPFPKLNGLTIFFGSRMLYYISIAAVLLFAVLLLSGTAIGLIIALVIALIATISFLMTYSEK